MRKLIALGCTLLAAPAFAGPTIGAYVDTNPIQETSELNMGLRLGTNLDVGVAEIIPQVGIARMGQTIVPHAGATARVGALIEPGVYAHLLFPATGDGLKTGLQAGGVLDFTALPGVEFGLHGGFVQDGTTPLAGAELSWVGGAHLAVKF